MRFLFLCKRHPMGRDLYKRPYGRFYHLPLSLARQGHGVHILLCNYKNEPDLGPIKTKDNITWYSSTLRRANPFHYYIKGKAIAQEVKPNWIIGFSDTYFGILAQHIASKCGSKSLIDAYDNYESYLPWCKPLHYLWRRALAKATIVSAAGPQLAALMGTNRPDKPPVVISMAADPIGFQPQNKKECRKSLGLPQKKKLVGYCGSIHPNRGISLLFKAIEQAKTANQDIELVLSGRKAPGISIPEDAHWCDYIPDDQMPTLINSLDLLTIINKSSSFGNYSYPVKLYEAICCQVPVVATKTPATSWVLKNYPELLAEPNDCADLSQKILTSLEFGRIDYGKEQGWSKETELFSTTMEEDLNKVK